MKVVSNNLAFIPVGQSEIGETTFLNKLNYKDINLYTVASKESGEMKIVCGESIGGKHPYVTISDVKSDKALESAMVYLYNRINDIRMEIQFANVDLITTCPDFKTTENILGDIRWEEKNRYYTYTPYLSSEDVALGENVVGNNVTLLWIKLVEDWSGEVWQDDTTEGLKTADVIKEVKELQNGKDK